MADDEFTTSTRRKEPDMLPRCEYCGLPTDGESLHPICAGEVSEAPLFGEQLTSCPDGDPACEVCSPDYPEDQTR